VSEYVKNNEPETLKYEINREVNKKSGAEQVIMIETCHTPHTSPKATGHVLTLSRQKQSCFGSPRVIKGIQGVSKENGRGESG